MARLRLFGAAREAAGTGVDVVEGSTVAEVLIEAERRFGAGFAAVLATCQVWVNGRDAERSSPVSDSDEVAVLPPFSGGC
jgi:molybdopterin converting factor small subunit